MLAGDLGDHLTGGDPNRRRQAPGGGVDLLLEPGADLGRSLPRLAAAGEVKERLVQRQRLYHRRVAAEHGEHRG